MPETNTTYIMVVIIIIMFFRFFALIGYYKILSIVPGLYSRSLLVIYFI